MRDLFRARWSVYHAMLASSNTGRRADPVPLIVSCRGRFSLTRKYAPPVRPYPEDILSCVVQASKQRNNQPRIGEPCEVGLHGALEQGSAKLPVE